MAVQEITSANWPDFCRRFETMQKRQIITIEQVNLAGARESIVTNAPLQGIRFEQSDGCSDRIFIVAGQNGSRATQHEIVEPIHVKVRQEADGRKAIQIDSESGSTLLSFSSGKMEQLLEGLG